LLTSQLIDTTYMKRYLPFLLLSLFSFSGFAQSLTIEDLDGNDVSNTTINILGYPSDETITTQFNVFNSNDETLNVDAVRYEDECITGSGEFFCWTLCLASEECGTNYVRGMPFALGVDGNSYSTLPLIVDFEPSYLSDEDGEEGNACYTYVLFDASNESDSVAITVCYNIAYANSINEYSANALSNVYPNPANEMIYVTMNESIDNARFEIYTMVGTRVASKQFSNANGKVEIEVSDLPNGVYMLTEVQSQITRRFIISR